jgi:hypothetical protein
MPLKNAAMRYVSQSILLALYCHQTVSFPTPPAFSNKIASPISNIALKIAVEPSDEVSTISTLLPAQTHDLPWTDFQEWALRDNIAKYTVSIPRKGASAPETYALWRTLGREVVELSGYPVEMLQHMHTRQLLQEDESARPAKTLASLPLLDDYQFEPSGGLSGKVYGILGLLDGTRVETSLVKDVQVTLPKGYVQTQDGSIAYELGMPLLRLVERGYSLGIPSSAVVDKVVGQAADQLDSTDMDLLVKLGATTGILLAGATAINMLSHHLTVNVFWV